MADDTIAAAATDAPPASTYAAATTSAGTALPDLGAGWGWNRSHDTEERDELIERARSTDAWAQLMRCFSKWSSAATYLRTAALRKLADNQPVDPNAVETWWSRDDAAAAVLRRHGYTKMPVTRLRYSALAALVASQAEADREAGLDWTVVTTPAHAIDDKLAKAHARTPIDLDDPAVWEYPKDQRQALSRRLGVDAATADELSRWTLANPDEFDPSDIRCWRIASPTWLELADRVLGPVDDVDRPVGVFVTPAKDGWQLSPALSLDMIRLIGEFGGEVGRDLTSAAIDAARIPDLVARINTQVLHTGAKELIDSRKQLAAELNKALGVPLVGGALTDKRDRWGRLKVSRVSYKSDVGDRDELRLSVLTFTTKEFQQRRVGSIDSTGHATPGAVMELGEAVNAAVERGMPLLLSTEAAGFLHGQVRVGRMKGRPGVLTITSADGFSATTRRVVAEQAVAELRELKASGANVTLDAGARQVMRMTLAKPLEDDPVLLGRQKEVAALMAVGSGVNASQVGTGKTIMSGRGALYHRAATTARFRALVVAEGRLLGQWRDELTLGAPGRGLPPLAPNTRVEILDDRSSVAAQIRQYDREVDTSALVLLVPTSILDRYPADLEVIRWHLLLGDEALRYVNPATEAHQALKQVRMSSVADCWLLTATPKGKTSEHLDVLVGLAVGDDAMIAERLNTREAGNLMDEVNAHRLRVSYGPHLVRVTREDMKAWMPDVLPAKPLVIDADDALTELLEAIRKGGREAYRKLLAVVRQLKELDEQKEKGSDLYKQALAEMSRAQATVLGNVNVFVDASVDPETLMHSQSALAQALVEQGIVQEAMRGGGNGMPLLRSITGQAIANVSSEAQVIVFAERVWCLRQLAKALRERFGVDAHVADGSITQDEFDALKQRFVAGEFPVLCLSKVGQEGHNLQNASEIVHLDLPWVQTGLEQRVGRAARPGSRSGYVQTTIPYIKGGGIEHVVSILAERGAEHHQILDSFEGVAASESTIANQLGAITSQVAESKDQAGFAATAARLRVAATVFAG